MQVETIVSKGDIETEFDRPHLQGAQLVLYFMSPDYPSKSAYADTLAKTYPTARILGCTTGGEIAAGEAHEKTAVCAALKLEQSHIKIAQAAAVEGTSSFETGRQLASKLDGAGLRLVFVLSDGLKVNGSELVRGMTDSLPKDVILTGGLAGDGPNFKTTGVGIDSLPQQGVLAAIGLYGEKLKISYGSVGGWLKFGPERLITSSKDNILYELDGQPALDLYKKYLGEEAENLPGSGLLFPLSIRPAKDDAHDIVRTIVGINAREKALVFAGDVPEGYIAQLMRGNVDNLADGAGQAATLAHDAMKDEKHGDCLGLLVSCIGRNILMGQRVSTEVEAVRQVLGNIPLVGFYSYGEICPHPVTHKCGLHNQTMTITLLSEAA